MRFIYKHIRLVVFKYLDFYLLDGGIATANPVQTFPFSEEEANHQ